MKQIFIDLAADVFVFLAAFILSTGACAHEAVACVGAAQTQAVTR